MATPVLVKAYSIATSDLSHKSGVRGKVQALPSTSSYAFADILRTANCPDFRSAIEGIAEICAKNRMSLADEYASHLPPLGEITATTSVTTRPHLLRPSMRRPLTSVPEGSSGSSEGSRRSKKSSRMSVVSRTRGRDGTIRRQIRIGSLGRTVAVGGTVSLAAGDIAPYHTNVWPESCNSSRDTAARPTYWRNSEATASLQRLLLPTPRENKHSRTERRPSG